MPTIAYQIEWDIGAGFVAMPGALGADVELQMHEGNGALGWGSSAVPRATIRADATTVDADWLHCPVRVRVSVDGGAYQDLFEGPLLEQDDDGISLSYTAGGWDTVIQRAPVRTPVRRRRPIATMTTELTDEDPDSGRPGWINEVFWRAGGRPYQQAGAYAGAPFYYVCDGSSIAPGLYCVDGENAWEALLYLAEGAGGSIYQDAGGVMHFVNPLALAESEADPPHLSDGSVTGGIPYHRLTRKQSGEGVISAAHAPFKLRAAQVMQEVYKDTTPKDVPPSSFRDVDLAMQWPILSYGAITVQAANSQGVAVAVTPTVLSQSGMRTTIRITNPSSTLALIVSHIAVQGEPVTVVAEGSASFTGADVGPTPSELRIPANDTIQTAGDARRLARLAVRFANTARPLYTASELPYDPRLIPGAYALLTNVRRGLAATPCRVTRVQVARSGAKITSLTLLPLAGLPKLSDFFIVGQTYADGDTRLYGY